MATDQVQRWGKVAGRCGVSRRGQVTARLTCSCIITFSPAPLHRWAPPDGIEQLETGTRRRLSGVQPCPIGPSLQGLTRLVNSARALTAGCAHYPVNDYGQPTCRSSRRIPAPTIAWYSEAEVGSGQQGVSSRGQLRTHHAETALHITSPGAGRAPGWLRCRSGATARRTGGNGPARRRLAAGPPG